MRNHEVTNVQKLLKEDGSLREPGWSRQLVQQYSRSDIKAPKFRIKEWDYYLIMNHEGKYAVSFTFDDNRYMGLVCCSVFDYETKDIIWTCGKSNKL